MFFRARHQAHRAADSWTKLGFALYLTLMSANKVVRRFQADHVIFCLEGRSWRKDHYKPYKANRAVARAAMNDEQAEEDKLFWETYDELHQRYARGGVLKDKALFYFDRLLCKGQVS